MENSVKELNELIKINHNFQKSVNLQLDLGNTNRIQGYIPTRSSAAILHRYLKAVDGREALNSTILIGPYGKGKSHLLLVLLSLLGKTCPKELLDKLGAVAPETAALAGKIQKAGKSYLPVLISPTSEANLKQTFLSALIEALQREDLSEIAPQTYFSQAVRVIEDWKESYPLVHHSFCEAVSKKYGTTIEAYVTELNKNSRPALDFFRAEYPSLTAGSIFMPMLYEDALKAYQQVNRVLREQYGYAGMFLVFDEFSKYIEGHEASGFAADMKVLQDICELANQSQDQLFFVLVAHKSIHEYTRSIDESVKNAFRGVEGRIREVEFVVSAQNNYELISDTITKCEPEFSAEYKKLQEQGDYAELLETSYRLPCFSQLFLHEEFVATIARGCFPMTPLCAYALLHISEKVAQNERTIFTFLADEGQGSLPWLLERGQETLLGMDCIYDYFKNLFRETQDAPQIHHEWLKAEYALSRTSEQTERAVIKAVAVIRMIHREDELPAQDTSIRIALGIRQAEYEKAITGLREKDILVYRSGIGVYAFRNNVGRNVEEEIQKRMALLKARFAVCPSLRRVSELEYELPKQYNLNYTMTRYFQYEYMTPEEFLQLEHADYLFEEKFADGKIILLVSEKAVDRKQIQAHLDKLGDIRVLLLAAKQGFSIGDLLLKYEAVQSLREDDAFIEENEILLQELLLCEEDLAFEINGRIEDLFLPENKNAYLLQCGKEAQKCKKRGELGRILSEICEQYYGLSPKVNHELLNIEHVGSQYLRARNAVIKAMLEGNDCSTYESGTMPEAMVYRAAFVHTQNDRGCEQVSLEIDRFFAECAGVKNTFQMLYKRLQGKNYGARKGIIPLFLARKLADTEGTAVIYIGTKELLVSAETLNQVNDFPEKYELYIEPETPEKEAYLKKLEEVFCEKKAFALSRQSRIAGIVNCMQNWYRSLPQYAMVTKQFPCGNTEHISALRNLLRRAEINPRELLFDRIPQVLEKSSYAKVADELSEVKQRLEVQLETLKNNVAREIKKEFDVAEQASLKAGLVEWYGIQSKASKSHVLTASVNGFMNYLRELSTNDELEIVARLSRIVLDIYVEDWNDDTLQQFVDELHAIRLQMEELSKTQNGEAEGNRIILKDADGREVEKYYEADITDSTSMYLKNTIEEALEEFGDTLEMNQKVAVLVKAIEGLLQ